MKTFQNVLTKAELFWGEGEFPVSDKCVSKLEPEAANTLEVPELCQQHGFEVKLQEGQFIVAHKDEECEVQHVLEGAVVTKVGVVAENDGPYFHIDMLYSAENVTRTVLVETSVNNADFI